MIELIQQKTVEEPVDKIDEPIKPEKQKYHNSDSDNTDDEEQAPLFNDDDNEISNLILQVGYCSTVKLQRDKHDSIKFYENLNTNYYWLAFISFFFTSVACIFIDISR